MSTMRIGGLASGMDIDSLVEQLMQAERAPLDKLEQKKQTYEWQRDAYRDVNTKLQALDTYISDNLIIKSLNSKTATSTNSDLVGAVATSTASGTLTIEGVSQLATAARAISSAPVQAKRAEDTSSKVATGSALIKDIDGFSSLSLSDTGEYSILLKSIDKTGSLGSTAEIKFKATDTIDDVVSKINSSAAGVTAFFENGKLSLTAKNTGELEGNAAEIQLVDEATINGNTVKETGNALFSLFNINFDSQIQHGTNAKLSVNGIEIKRSSNNFTVNGYSISLKEKFNTSYDNTGETVSLTSTTNVDEIITKIKDFVNTYNGLIKDLTSKTNETKYRDYQPLTEAQKEDMESDEIEKWEKFAKSGLLRSDSIIKNGLSAMRSLVYQSNPAVTNTKYNTLYSIGITTSSDYTSGGTLEIDEDKLRAALEADPDSVTKVLTFSNGKEKDTVEVNGVTKEADTRGFLQKLRSTMSTIKLNIENRAGRSTMNETQYTLGKSLKSVATSIDAWKDKLELLEDRYWKRFTAMETAINKANSQSTSLSSYFA